MKNRTSKTKQTKLMLSDFIHDWYTCENETVKKYIEAMLLTQFNVTILEEKELTPAGFVRVACNNIETQKEIVSDLFWNRH